MTKNYIARISFFMARDGKGHGFNKMAPKNDDIMQRPNFKTKTMYVEVIFVAKASFLAL